METNFTPWNDTLEIMGDAMEEILCPNCGEEMPATTHCNECDYDTRQDAPEAPDWTEEELCDFAARSEGCWPPC